MDKKMITPETTVADLLARWPQVIPIFLQHHMSCVGCSMSAFETLADAAKIYKVNLPDFIAELATRIESV